MKEKPHPFARYISIAECPHKCTIHLILHDENDRIIAEAPFSAEMCRRYGKILTRVGNGEDPEKVLVDSGFAVRT